MSRSRSNMAVLAGESDILADPEKGGILLGAVRMLNQPQSAAPARRFVRLMAELWDVPHVADNAELLTSELIANAVRYVRQRQTWLRLVVIRRGQRMRVELHDIESRMPRQRTPSLEDEYGRGLMLIGNLAADYSAIRTGYGKCVWFELDAWTTQNHR